MTALLKDVGSPGALCSTDPWHLDGFELWMRGWGASTNTMKVRLKTARLAAARWPDPRAVRSSDVTAYLADGEFSRWTRHTYYCGLHSLFKWLADEGHIDVDPTAKMRRPTAPKHRPRPLSDEQAERALDAATGDLRTWLLLGLYCGLRVHEVAKLAGQDVTEDYIYVRGKGEVDAEVPTHPLVWEAAQHYPAIGYWFPGHKGRDYIAPNTLINRVTEHFRLVGITEGSFHRTRHAYATSLLRAGVNLRVVQTLMRHQNLNTTAAYLAVDENERAAAVRLIGMPG